MMGEQPLHGELLVKFGSEISWWPSGSPGLVVGPGTGRRPSVVDALVGIPDRLLASGTPLTCEPSGGRGVPTAEEGGMSVPSDGSSCGSDDAMGLDGIRPLSTSAGVVISMDVGEGSTSVAGASEGTMVDVRGFEGISPGGKDVRGADGIRPVNPKEHIKVSCDNPNSIIW
jgi:hypothetical protein